METAGGRCSMEVLQSSPKQMGSETAGSRSISMCSSEHRPPLSAGSKPAWGPPQPLFSLSLTHCLCLPSELTVFSLTERDASDPRVIKRLVAVFGGHWTLFKVTLWLITKQMTVNPSWNNNERTSQSVNWLAFMGAGKWTNCSGCAKRPVLYSRLSKTSIIIRNKLGLNA